jgi:hypothetical protein
MDKERVSRQIVSLLRQECKEAKEESKPSPVDRLISLGLKYKNVFKRHPTMYRFAHAVYRKLLLRI